MFRKILLMMTMLAFGISASAQSPVNPTPNCVFGATFTAAGRSATLYNNLTPTGSQTAGCTTWTLVYSSSGFSAVSIELDEAPDSSGTPGSWVVFPNVASGTLPLTATTQGQVTVFKFFPWVSINVNSVTGTGTITATAYGWKPGPNSDANSVPTADVTASAANLTAAFNSSDLVEKGPRWTVISNPASGSQATASKTAGGAGVRHIADCVSFSAASSAAPALTLLTINLRDGATGAGTIIWTQQVVILASAGQNVSPFSACGLALPGSANTAMTLEFSAGLTSLVQAVSISGFDVN